MIIPSVTINTTATDDINVVVVVAATATDDVVVAFHIICQI